MLVACNGEDRIRLRRTKNFRKNIFHMGGQNWEKFNFLQNVPKVF
jgi:hypothetical protein